jgi:phosphoribosyl-AMP cyclohydrolase
MTIEINFEKLNGLIPAVAQDYKTNEVLMVAFMNPEAWKKTLETGIVHYFSRTRNKLWMKGEESGNIQKVKEIFVDCENNSVLIKIEQVGGAACHTGYNSCFYRKIENGELKIIKKEKVFNPEEKYGSAAKKKR